MMIERRIAREKAAGSVRDRGAGLFFWTAGDTATSEFLPEFSPDGIATDAISQQLSAFCPDQGQKKEFGSVTLREGR